MSGEKEARMLGSGEEIEVNETYSNGKSKKKTYKILPIRARELLELERKALAAYKREYLSTFKENAADVFGQEATKILKDEMTKVARWTLDDLPQKEAFSMNQQVQATDKVLSWVIEYCGIDFSEELQENEEDSEEESSSKRLLTEIALSSIITTALDRGDVSPEKILEVTGKRPIRGRIRYDQWWVTGPLDGMVAYIWESLKRTYSEDTINEGHILSTWSYIKIVEISRQVDRITQASLGNG